MAAELQALLDKIQTEGVAKAEAEAARVLADASAKAAEIVAKAKAEESAAKERVQAEAKLFEERAEANIRQAARDVVLGAQKSVDAMLQKLLLGEISGAMTAKAMADLLPGLVAALAKETDAAVELPAEQIESVKALLVEKARSEAAAGNLKLVPGEGLHSGFRIALSGGRVEYDFSAEALRGEMARLLRPELAELLK